jgi:hypothetical protein
MIQEVAMIRKAGFLAWIVCAVAACSSNSGTPSSGAGGSLGVGGAAAGGAIGSAVVDGGQDGIADTSGAGGYVSNGALDTAPAIYIVPAGPDTPEVRYAIGDPMVTNEPGNFRVDYTMPTLLVGSDQMVSLRGSVDTTGRAATVSGDVGTATCDLAPGDGFAIRCNETLTNIQVDLGEVQRMTQSLPAPMAALFVGVASRFSGEPIGIVEIR